MNHFTTVKATRPAAKLALVALGALAGVLGAGFAGAAGSDSDVPSIVVKYTNQSLATDSGVKDLYARIVRAAKQVCPDAPDVSIRNLNAERRVTQCRDQAIARAIRKVDNSQLAALYATHSKNG
jgi:UrcA family protein